jgi:hypothetical protein
VIPKELKATVLHLGVRYPRRQERARAAGQAQRRRGRSRGALLLRCIEESIDCGATCTSCADADLAEPDTQELLRCARLCLDCADVCDATGRILIRQTEPDLGVLGAAIEACAVVCQACAEECEMHASHHEHCRICAEVCRRCDQACQDLLAAIRS